MGIKNEVENFVQTPIITSFCRSHRKILPPGGDQKNIKRPRLQFNSKPNSSSVYFLGFKPGKKFNN